MISYHETHFRASHRHCGERTVLYNKTNRRTNFQIYSGTKHHMFRAVSLPIIRSLPLYIRHWRMVCRFDDSLRAGSGWNWQPDPARKLSSNLRNMRQCRMYSGRLLMMGRETARNM